MPTLSKSCPQCLANVNVKKSVCDCGHCFVLKRNVSLNKPRKSQRIANRYKRALESPAQTMHRQEQNRASMAQKRALESPSDTLCRQEKDRKCIAKKESSRKPK